jgi:copper(I)-binding protein
MEEAGQGTAEAASQGMGMTGTGAVFMRVINDGQGPDRLVGGETDVARVVEIHETVMEGDVTTMQMLANGLEIPAKSEVLLKPGSFHVMLIGMQRDLAVGDRFNITLQFEESGEMDLAVQVQEP